MRTGAARRLTAGHPLRAYVPIALVLVGIALGPGYWVYANAFRNLPVATVTIAEGSVGRLDAEQAWTMVSSTPRSQPIALSPGMNPLAVSFEGLAFAPARDLPIVLKLTLQGAGALGDGKEMKVTLGPVDDRRPLRRVRADFRGLEVEEAGQYEISIRTADESVALVEARGEVIGRAFEESTWIWVFGLLGLGAGGILLWIGGGEPREARA